jgi:hypothetical protein
VGAEECPLGWGALPRWYVGAAEGRDIVGAAERDGAADGRETCPPPPDGRET